MCAYLYKQIFLWKQRAVNICHHLLKIFVFIKYFVSYAQLLFLFLQQKGVSRSRVNSLSAYLGRNYSQDTKQKRNDFVVKLQRGNKTHFSN